MGIEVTAMRCYLSRNLLLSGVLIALATTLGVISSTSPALAIHLTGGSATYTLDVDFDDGTLINVNHDTPDELQLDGSGSAFNFIWVAASARGTITKIDTLTGTVLGEYRAAPQGMGLNPSRTTVDANGNVWSGNRAEQGFIGGVRHGSVVKIGLEENGQCVDRNSNGVIDTSSGLGDIKAWPNVTDGAGSTDSAAHGAQVQDAADECILIFQRTRDADAVRHVSIDAGNDVWIGGYPFAQRSFLKLDKTTGMPLASFDARRFGCGGYGGFIDGNNVLWSASISQSRLLRYDLGTSTGGCIGIYQSYGLGLDGNGFVWNSRYGGNAVTKVSAAGGIVGTYGTGGASNDRGVAITTADHFDGNGANNVWVANSGGNTVSRLRNNGAYVTQVTVGSTPTGVAVDAAGKVWATNLGSNSASRINPLTNSVDLTVNLGSGAGPYNYSDMTGSITPAPPTNGTWSVIHDSGMAGVVEWGTVSWNSSEPGDSSITVTAASSNNGVIFGAAQAVTDGVDLTVANGRYLKVTVSFARATTGETPILEDLSIDVAPRVDCDPFVSFDVLPATLSFDGTAVPNGPAGTYSFDARLINTSTDDLFDLTSPVATLTGGNTVLGFPESPATAGDTVTIPTTGGYSDGVLSAGESADIPWIIGLAARAQFDFYVDVACRTR